MSKLDAAMREVNKDQEMGKIRIKNPVPVKHDDWLNEIARAYCDAREAIPFAELIDHGQKMGEENIFHFASAVSLKFRGIRRTNDLLEKATEAALSSYVATQDKDEGMLKSPHIAFAFCYVASHFGLGLITHERGTSILSFLESKDVELASLIEDESRKYDTSWNNPGNRKSFYDKSCQWEKRKWISWLKETLSFPFDVKRKDDEDDAYFTDVARHQPFRLGHAFSVIALVGEDDHYGVIAKVKEGHNKGQVPLCDVDVISRYNPNYWPVKEYAVWFANK